jgi:hypothetical protein
MSNPTPGPWRVKIKSGRACVIADKAPGEYRSGFQYKLVAQCGTTNQKEANAVLIAAAPDLLEAAEAILARASATDHDPAITDLRNAVAKARGTTP